jgi:pSer/pThr/pTyr-binding forkhead associated (FHA) protein
MEASGTGGAGAPEKLRLKIVSGNAAGDTVEVGQEEFIIGRQAEGAGSLANDIEISRTHARITGEADGSFVIEDLGSTNGTYVNGRRIDRPLALEVGDRIEVGASALVVQVGAIQPTPAASETVAPPSRSAPATEAAPEPAGTEVPDVEAAPEPGVAEAAPEPVAEVAEEAAPAALPPFSLRIEVDPAAGKATVALDDDSEEIGLIHSDGRWRLDR